MNYIIIIIILLLSRHLFFVFVFEIQNGLNKTIPAAEKVMQQGLLTLCFGINIHIHQLRARRAL